MVNLSELGNSSFWKEDLPLLTFVAQVNTESPQDILQLQAHIIFKFEKQLMYIGNLSEHVSEVIPPLVMVCKMVREWMNTLVEEGGIYPEQARQLRMWLYHNPRIITWPEKRYTDKEIIPTGSFEEAIDYNGRAFIFMRVLEDFKELLFWSNCRVARCKECQSPFVWAKEGQRFCSDRCSNRARQRRRRQEKKISTAEKS